MARGLMRRPRRRPVSLPPLPDTPLDERYIADIERARLSMAAFDGMPEDWRRFCAHYPRNARGSSLADLLDEAGGNVARARRMLRQLLPVRTE
jgi:hypothetical protein